MMDYSDMTYEQAEDVLNDTQHVAAQDEMGGHAVYLASIALEKRIPNSPDEDYEETLYGEYFNGYKCPACHHHIGYGGAYCEWCGQALDWEVKE